MADSWHGSIRELREGLDKLQNQLNLLIQSREKLEHFGGSLEYIKKLQKEIERLQELENKYSPYRTTKGASGVPNSTLNEGIVEINAEYEKIQNKVTTATLKAAVAEEKYANSVKHTKESLENSIEVFEKRNEVVLGKDEGLKDSLGALKDSLSNAQTKEDVAAVAQKFKLLSVEISNATKKSKDFEKQQKQAREEAKAAALASASEVASYVTTIKTKIVDGLWNAALGFVRNIFEATKQLDAELVEIRKVTNLTEKELTAFVGNVQQIGNRTATTTSQLLEASAVFARSGYSTEQIEKLTEEAAVLKNVSDGITDMSQSAQVLISVMKAYDIPAEKARTITDQLNIISNNAAISFDDLAEGISRVGSVFASQDTSVGQLSAMLTGANEILQDIRKTSNGLKTISQRLRQIKGDSAKLQGLIGGITEKYGEVVNITDIQTGQLRGTYDILADLARVWDKLTKNEQQLIGEQLAGKNQITVLQALLNNWEGVQKAVENVDNAAGSAAKEQNAYLNSLTGALNQFKASLENMYASIQMSPILTGLVRMGSALIDIVNKIGIVPISLGLISGKVTSLFKNVTSGVEKISGLFSLSTTNLKDSLKDVLKILTPALKPNAYQDVLNKVKNITDLTKEERESFVELLKYDSERNLSLAQRIALSNLQKKADADTIASLGKQVALEQALNAARTIGVSLLVAGGVALVSGIISHLKKERENIIKTYTDSKSRLKDIESQIEAINEEIDSMGGAKTIAQTKQLEELNLELYRTEKRAEAAKKKYLELVEARFQYAGYGTGYLKFEDKTSGVDIEYKEKDILKFFDEVSNRFVVTEENYAEVLDVIEGDVYNFFDGLRDSTDENVQRAIAQLDSLKESLKEYERDLKEDVTLGITQESVEDYLRLVFEEAIDTVSGELDWHKIFEGIESVNVDDMVNYFGQPIDSFIERMHQLNKENIELWQRQYTEIYAVSRGLQEYADLYEQATGTLSSSQLLNILDNWDKYADILVVENGELRISKELVLQKAKAQIETLKSTLRAKIAEAEQTVAMEKLELAATKQALANAKAIINANNRKIESTRKYTAVKQAQIMAEKGEIVEADRYMADVNKYQTSIDQLTVAIANQESYINNLKGQIEALDKIDLESLMRDAASSTSRAASSTSKAADATKQLNEELNKLKNLLSALQKQMSDTTDVYQKVQAAMKDIIEAEIDALEEENDALDEGVKYYNARIKLIEEYYDSGIDKLKEQQKAAEDANEAEQQALKDKIDALKESTKEYEKQNKAQQDNIDVEVQALEDQIKAIEEANKAREDEVDMQQRLLEIEKARLAAEKAKDAYEAAKRSKTVRTYDAERGWVYTADQGAVSAAYGEYTSAQRNYEKLQEELAKIQADAQVQAEKDAIQAQIDALKEQKESLKELLDKTKEDADKQEEDWNAEIDVLKEQKDAISENFEKQIDELEKQSDSLSNIEDDVERMLDRYLNDEDVLAWVEAYKAASEEERRAMEADLRSEWAANRKSALSNEEQIDQLKDLLTKVNDMLKTTESVLESEGVKAWLESFKGGDYTQRDDMITEMRNAYLDFVTAQQAEIDKVQASIDKLEGTINVTNQLLANWGTGKSNTPVNSYANGGVVDSGLLMNTGMLSNRVKVHGTPSSPEVILNGRQQANLLYRLGQQKPSVINNNNAGASSSSVYVANLTIQADSNDTLRGLLLQARQLAVVG